MKTWAVAAGVVLAAGAAAGGYWLYAHDRAPAASPVLAEASRGFATCVSPTPPGTAPDGGASTKEQMLAARRAATEFDTATTNYTACLKGVESQIRAAHHDAAATDLQKLGAMATTLNNGAIDRDQHVADQVNAEIRRFKARNP